MPSPICLAVRLAALALLGAGLAGCPSQQLALSQGETGEILDEVGAQVAAERAEARESTQDLGRATREVPDIEVPEVVGLEDALRIAARLNRDLLRGREGLELSAVALRNARYDVGLQLSGTVGYFLRGTEDLETTEGDDVSLSASDLLPTGGDLSLTAAADRGHGKSSLADSTADGSLSLRLSQPLLRGAGYESSHEGLTSAQQQALYDVRDFELQRQDLALRVQREFYSLVADKAVIANRELSLQNFEFLKQRSEALFEVNRVSEVDRFRAAREYLTAENALVDARQAYATRLDRFKVLLGLDTAVQLDVADTIPDPREIDLELSDAIAVALRNRLDVMTARDQVADAERRLRIAERDLLPRVDLEAVHTRSSLTERRLQNLEPDRDSYSVGVSVEIPLDRVRERGALRSARISLSRARRSLALLEDNVLLDGREALRDLRSSTSSLAIQEQIVVSEEKNAKVSRLRFEQGEIGNRDLTDALLALANARDSLVREKANVETARLQLLREMGVLVIEEDGTWQD